MTNRGGRVAVLGAGMLGACTALELARRGRRMTLVDRAADVMQRASRWNEGKIHLGFLYPADPSLGTATRLIPAALAFRGAVERLIGRSLEPLSSGDDVYLVHRNSVVDAEAYGAYAEAVMRMIGDAAGGERASYLRDLRTASVHRLSPSELADATPSDHIVAGFLVPERSVSTVPVADAITAAVRAEPLIEVRTGVEVRAVRRRDDGRLDVIVDGDADDGFAGFDVVVNALWEGRPAVDASLGIVPPGPWSHRFRAAIYAKARASSIRNATVCTGPFGDVKQYSDGRLYLSWYDAGLLAEGNDVAPPCADEHLSAERLARVRGETLAALARFFPDVARLGGEAEAIEVRAGWVYAIGRGSLADRASELHRRDQFVLTEDRGYISVDTGKYSVAPWLAEQVALRVCA